MGTGDRAGGQRKALGLLAGLWGRQGGLGMFLWLPPPHSILTEMALLLLSPEQSRVCHPHPPQGWSWGWGEQSPQGPWTVFSSRALPPPWGHPGKTRMEQEGWKTRQWHLGWAGSSFPSPFSFQSIHQGELWGALTLGLCSVPPVLSPVLSPDNSGPAQAKQNPSHREAELISENPAPSDLPADSGRDK